MIIPLPLLDDLLGKTAHLHRHAEKYDQLKSYKYHDLLFFQNEHSCKMFFTFVNEAPFWKNNNWFYCLADSELGDYYWFTLNQLIICTD